MRYEIERENAGQLTEKRNKPGYKIRVRSSQFEVWFSGTRVKVYTTRAGALAYIVRASKDWNVTCSKCDRSFSSSIDFHSHVRQGCK